MLIYAFFIYPLLKHKSSEKEQRTSSIVYNCHCIILSYLYDQCFIRKNIEMLNWPGSYLAFSRLGLEGVLPADEKPLSLSEESPFLREIHSLNGLWARRSITRSTYQDKSKEFKVVWKTTSIAFASSQTYLMKGIAIKNLLGAKPSLDLGVMSFLWHGNLSMENHSIF